MIESNIYLEMILHTNLDLTAVFVESQKKTGNLTILLVKIVPKMPFSLPLKMTECMIPV